MKALLKYFFSLAILLACVFLSGITHGQSLQSLPDDHFEAENWSGTITLTETWTSKRSGNYSDYVFKSHDTYNIQKMSATIRNGKGTTTASYLKNEEHIYKEKLPNGSTAITTTKDVGSAIGNGVTELTIGYDENAKTYSLEVSIPASSGKAQKTITCSGCGGVDPTPSSYEIGNDPSGIMVEDQKLGTNPNVLTGETVTKASFDDGTGTHEIVIRWSFYKGKDDQWLQVVPQQYSSWLPIPDNSEAIAGSKLQVGFQLKGKNGKAPLQKVDHFELQLVNTSHEPGVTINFPLTPSTEAPKPDIQFLDQAGAVKSTNGQTISIPCKDGISGSVAIGAFDGGGYSTLQVIAVIRGGMRLSGHLEVEDGDIEIQVPKREPGSKIATKWLQENGTPSADADNETSTGNQHNGDGLSAYEEYRGVFSEGKFLRLNPTRKELGVQVNREDLADLNGGIALFSTAANITAIKLWNTELGADRIINKNGSSHHLGMQYALRLKKGALAKGVMGENKPAGHIGKTAKESELTVIDIAQLRSSYTEQVAVSQKESRTVPYTVEDDIANTVAHELAHGVGISHHGEPSSASNKRVSPGMLIYAPDGSPASNVDIIAGTIGVPHNEASGDVGCIMAYTAGYSWVLQRGTAGEMIYRALPILPPGKRFCTSAQGTGINTNNGYFGDATKGNCISQMIINTAH